MKITVALVVVGCWFSMSARAEEWSSKLTEFESRLSQEKDSAATPAATTEVSADGDQKEEVIVVSIKDVLADPAKYDGKKIKITGSVQDLQKKTSRAGNPYTVFKVGDGDSNQIGVYAPASLEISENQKVEVTGKYAVEKNLGSFTVKNQIDAAPEQVQPAK